MGCDNGPSYGEIVREAAEFKRNSKSDPRGVIYLDHLHELIAGSKPLTLVLRTSDQLFDVPVECAWVHGWFSHQNPDTDIPQSELIVNIPNEIYRRIQSKHAGEVMNKLFGQSTPVELPAAIRPDPDEGKRSRFGPYPKRCETEVFTNDWAKFCAAVEAGVRNSQLQLGGQSLLVGNAHTAGYARINGARLEIMIPDRVVGYMARLWDEEFQKQTGSSRR